MFDCIPRMNRYMPANYNLDVTIDVMFTTSPAPECTGRYDLIYFKIDNRIPELLWLVDLCLWCKTSSSSSQIDFSTKVDTKCSWMKLCLWQQ
jgi:hypothetical protein